MEEEKLPIGFKHGCYTVIAGFDTYQREVADIKIKEIEEDKAKYLRGEKTEKHYFSVDDFDRHIQFYRKHGAYKVRCKCGKEYFRTYEFLLRKRWRDCGDDCDIKINRDKAIVATYPRQKLDDYYLPLLGTYHDTLEIVECVNDNYESAPIINHIGRKGAGLVFVHKQYRCKCFLCGKESLFLSCQFGIHSYDYGSKAKLGYICNAYCPCREESLSSFQWRTTKILKENNVSFRAEWSFDDLYGIGGVNHLRFDFAVFNPDDSIKCLIECQGQQHSEPVYEFGGEKGFERQQANDELKRKYAAEHGYKLLEISHKINTYDKEVAFLQKNGII